MYDFTFSGTLEKKAMLVGINSVPLVSPGKFKVCWAMLV